MIGYINEESEKKQLNFEKRDLVYNKLSKIINDDNENDSYKFAMAATWIILHFKGENVQILDMKEHSTLANYFIIADVMNNNQARAIKEMLLWNMKRFEKKILGSEGGGEESNWTLIDLDDIVIHLFVEKSREIYQLEKLWKNVKKIEIPENFYFNQENKPFMIPSSESVNEFGHDQDSDHDYF